MQGETQVRCRDAIGWDGGGIGTSGKGPNGVWNQSDSVIGSATKVDHYIR
jgi:hypothetical protein